MIKEFSTYCEHGIKYQNPEFCFYQDCKQERRLRNSNCIDCSAHFHKKQNYYFTEIINSANLSSLIYEELCQIEFQMFNQKSDVNLIQKQTFYAASLIKNFQYIECLSESLLFKIHQINQFLEQQNQLEHTLEFEQLENQQKLKLQSKLTDNCQLVKVFFNIENICYLATSPNEKYVLIGSINYMYLYDISTKLNKKIYQLSELNYVAQFSQDSAKIIVAIRYEGILTYDILTNKKKSIKMRILGGTSQIQQMYVYKNQLYLVQQIETKYKFSMRLIKINLTSNRQIYSHNLQEVDKVYFYYDLFTCFNYQFQYIINESNRKTQLQIDLRHYQIKKLIIINKYEMLSLQQYRKLVVWNIDYANYKIIIEKTIPLDATDIIGINPNFGYFYLILDNTLQIIDKNYNQIYKGEFTAKINKIMMKGNSNQFNSDKIFMVFQEGIILFFQIIIEWLCLLLRTNEG